MTVPPQLIVLRGNSGSGKSSVARALRERSGYGMAWVEQDYLRRVLLREHDVPDGKNIELIALNVSYALEHGYHVVLEGILTARNYGPMLERLHHEHGGSSHFYLFDLPFEETVRRHATRPQAREFGPEMMRGWYQERDRLPFVEERIIPADSTLEATVERLWHETGLQHAQDAVG
ncbi:kinase [Deinococcus sp. SDU3-2]|uniref:Kinase n=1 Tax=Deinococcus terrestris TaxID=2651870 RepID=A0A7X1NX72_9DEIO|nr:kinase [Deinococcus terrestris]MPY67338.1 kinase [Deinococcus terrestris]